MKTLLEQISELEATRAAKAARMETVIQKSMDEGRSTDVAEGEEFDTLNAEIASIDKDLQRLKSLEEITRKKVAPVSGANGKSATENRGHALVKNTQKKLPGTEFAQYVMCLGAAKGELSTAVAIAAKRFPDSERVNVVLKAAVEAGTTTDATWAMPLVEYTQFAGDFIEFLRPQTIIGRFGANGIPSLRQVPFNIHIRGQTSGGEGYWVGQGAPKPLTSLDFDDTYLGFAKVANIAVLSEELLRFSNPSAEMLVRDALAAALIQRMDTDFIDPAKVLVANVSPASITNGVTPIASSGTDAQAVRNDINALWAASDDANLLPNNAVYIADSKTARALSLMRNGLGQKEFPGVTMMGGDLDGIPLLISNYVPRDSNGSLFILAFASEIYLSDDGLVTVDASREASLQMLNNPTNNSATATGTTMVSMFQTNSVAMRAERYINWKKRRATAVSYLSGVNWSVSA